MMTENEYWANRSSRDEMYVASQHDMAHSSLCREFEYKLFSMLKPNVYRDGSAWCVSYGNAPEGIQGFGNTIHEAVLDFNKSFVTPIKTVKP